MIDLQYRTLFKNAPISLWLEDYSELKSYLDRLHLEGVTHLDTYLELFETQHRADQRMYAEKRGKEHAR